MKTKLFLAALFLGMFSLLTSNSFSQDKDCCAKGETMQCCAESKACCEPTGNAGGDSAVTGLTCPVSGEAIGEGQGVKVDYYGKTYTLCCEGCQAKFKKEPMNYIKEEMTCPVMGETVVKDVFVMHEGTKYYLCCESCVKKFEKNPDKYKKGIQN